ncbi:hypothetical protein G9A89_007036 [Geosiphon pyriformis]|nr:hypothetical protein G9A89_007036 [Geosiphon pyriformis]
MTTDVKIGVIGGTGLYALHDLKFVREVYEETPWGYPSDKIKIMHHSHGINIAFLARHGQGHILNPSEVPSRANIAALKHIGVKVIIAYSSVGSLREEIKPRDFVVPSQIIDRTKGIRPSTFFEKGIAGHAMFSDPFNETLAEIIWAQRELVDVDFHKDKTLICMEGPAFSTRAESNLYRAWGGDIINMSALPEAKLAREAEIAYQMICMSTDYDCWKKNEEPVTVEMVLENLGQNGANARKLLEAVLPILEKGIIDGKFDHVKGTMKYSSITDGSLRNSEAVRRLEYILPGYFS